MIVKVIYLEVLIINLISILEYTGINPINPCIVNLIIIFVYGEMKMDVLKYYGKFYPYNTLLLIISLIILRILYFFLKPYLPYPEETYNV